MRGEVWIGASVASVASDFRSLISPRIGSTAHSRTFTDAVVVWGWLVRIMGFADSPGHNKHAATACGITAYFLSPAHVCILTSSTNSPQRAGEKPRQGFRGQEEALEGQQRPEADHLPAPAGWGTSTTYNITYPCASLSCAHAKHPEPSISLGGTNSPLTFSDSLGRFSEQDAPA